MAASSRPSAARAPRGDRAASETSAAEEMRRRAPDDLERWRTMLDEHEPAEASARTCERARRPPARPRLRQEARSARARRSSRGPCARSTRETARARSERIERGRARKNSQEAEARIHSQHRADARRPPGAAGAHGRPTRTASSMSAPELQARRRHGPARQGEARRGHARAASGMSADRMPRRA